MSHRDQRDRVTPWILLLALTLVLWLGLKFDADASSAASPVPRSLHEAIGPAVPSAASEADGGSGSGSRFPEPEELPGFGEETLLPALFDALGATNCDLDDPFSPCQ